MKKNQKMNSLKQSAAAVLLAALSVCCLPPLVSPLYAAFLDSGWGVRPLGMAGAFTAVADDSSAQLYNPAGLALVEQKEFSFMSAKLYSGLDGVDIALNYAGYVEHLSAKAGSFGIAWGALSSPSLYREDTASFGYGRSLNDIFKSSKLNISLGANIKYLKHEYTLDVRTVDDPVFANGQSAAATTFDAGLLVELKNTGMSFALASRNMTSPDVGLGSVDKVLAENVFGVAFYSDEVSYLKLPYFTSALDIVSRGQYTDARLGIESWFFDGKFAVRAGAKKTDITLGLGYEIAIGESIKVLVDYALAWPLEIEESSGSHRFGISVRFP